MKLTAESAHLLAVEVEVVLVGGVGSAEVLVSAPAPPIGIWTITTAYGREGIIEITQNDISGNATRPKRQSHFIAQHVLQLSFCRLSIRH